MVSKVRAGRKAKVKPTQDACNWHTPGMWGIPAGSVTICASRSLMYQLVLRQDLIVNIIFRDTDLHFPGQSMA